ncbi:CAP domain-containing protein [Clostridium perfringens]|uniref:CAP domain-containing protein n=1 Tax=Clostridium perfringens TaxID=1502 RepID=UPI0024BCFDCC|nr:CAP domain-containing protein [Clostridium perfringens]MDK0616263.1 CAP domain-containing protein [Clostridium perfringens]MDK0928483.1 CAP domain-containing protein [Clostridium perfringens]MDK0934178.1 CAP domain-containing protein [Clostridium perfringens]MDK0953674.1 CAP domain-containing protein [Clostridium perfringens]MDK0968338.1 CAP domain-containing protein [Clostridium perfringens]
MNKRIKAIIEFVKVHKKETIGVAVALGIAVVGVGGYAISKHYANTDTNNIALAEKKEDPKADADKKLEENKATDNEEVTVEEQEDGSLIVKDKDGNIIADSSKGDDVSKIVEEKKEARSDVNIKNKKGEVEKVESVDNGSIKVTSGETIGSKTENKVQASQQPSGEKVEKVEDIKGTTASSEGSITIVKPSKEESSSKPESKPQEQPEESKPEEAPQPSQKPEEKPQEQKPVEKPQRTWEYQSGMTQEIWNDFNAYRQSQGLNALNWSGKYAGWTKSHCEEMAQKQSGFHKSYPEGGQIVYDGTAYTSASSILNGFKNSPAHNKNMLDPDLTEGACAVYKDSNGRYYTVIGFDY